MDITTTSSQKAKVKIEPSVKMDPEKRSKSIILNPHLWSLKRTLLQRPRGRPRKNPAPERCGKDRLKKSVEFVLCGLKLLKLNFSKKKNFAFQNFFCPLKNFANICNCYISLSKLLYKNSFKDLKSFLKAKKGWKKSVKF